MPRGNTKTIPGAPPIAAIDIGSNSAHLVVANVSPTGTLYVLDSEKVVLRLGQALDEHKNLSASAIARTTTTMLRLKEISDAYSAVIRAVATHATREALNHDVLIREVEKATGIHIEIIDGIEEARLCFLGMRHGVSIDQQTCLAVDIGGGSTEVVLGQKDDIHSASSIKVGAVTVTKKFQLDKKRPSIKDLHELERHVYVRLSTLIPEAREAKFERALASSGTAKALAQLDDIINGNSSVTDFNGYRLKATSIKQILEELRTLSEPKKIRAAYGIDASRAEIILAGAQIMHSITELFAVSEWLISSYALREGLVIDTYLRNRDHEIDEAHPDIRIRSILAFGRKFRLEEAHSRHVAHLALEVFEILQKQCLPKQSREDVMSHRELLYGAAFLHEIGKVVSYPRYHRHSQYLITNSNLMGFTEDEKLIMGLVARFHRKRILGNARLTELTYGNIVTQSTINVLSTCVRIASALDRTRRGRVPRITGKISDSQINLLLHIEGTDQPAAELGKLQDEQRAIEKALGRKLFYEITRVD